jgi:hypothetical protein
MRLARSTAAALVSLWSSSFVSADSARAECFRDLSGHLANAATCGDLGSINWCISRTPSALADAAAKDDLATVTVELESCFFNAGCTHDEAQSEAFWTLRRCEMPASDLRRRFAGLAEEPLPARDLPFVDVLVRNVVAIGARQDTTELPASPSPCLTTTSISINSCPHQSTGPNSGKPLPCFPTTVPSLACAAGLICQSNHEGAINCMYAKNGLEISGIIVAIVMAAAIALSIIGVCFFCCRERRTQSRLAKAAEAAAIAREAKAAAMVAAKRPEPRARAPSPDHQAQQPLMAESADAGSHGPNPFADIHPALR